jgi:hypothetical protein
MRASIAAIAERVEDHGNSRITLHSIVKDVAGALPFDAPPHVAYFRLELDPGEASSATRVVIRVIEPDGSVARQATGDLSIARGPEGLGIAVVQIVGDGLELTSYGVWRYELSANGAVLAATAFAVTPLPPTH